jgi:hypothetical protein
VKRLLDARCAPTTDEVGLVEAPPETVVGAYVDWTKSFGPRFDQLRTTRISGTLEQVLRRLLPLTSIQRRRLLFVPTRSRWTAYFGNGHQGTDAGPLVGVLAEQLKCHGVRCVAVPDTSKEPSGKYGALIFELFGPNPNPILNYVRTVSLANDGGRWVFETSGVALAVEDVARYDAKRKRDRFDFESLDRILASLDIRAFDEDFYMPEGATLVEWLGPGHADAREFDVGRRDA